MTRQGTGLLPARKRESPQSLAAFQVYAEMGIGRTLEKAAAKMAEGEGRAYSARSLMKWSSKWGWQQRVEAYDRMLAEKERLARMDKEAEERAKRKDERLQDARIIRQIVRASLMYQERDAGGRPVGSPQLRRVEDRVGTGDPPQQLLTSDTLDTLVRALARMGDEERKDSGEATSRIAQEVMGRDGGAIEFADVSTLTDQQIEERLLRILAVGATVIEAESTDLIR